MRSTPMPLEIFRTVNVSLRPAVLAGDAHALEGLDALLVALAHEVVDPDGVAGSEVGTVVPKLLLLDLLNEVSHRRLP